MLYRNHHTEDILLGAVHNGRHAEDSLNIKPGATCEISDFRIKCYAPEDLKNLKPVTAGTPAAPAPAPAPEPVKPPAPVAQVAPPKPPEAPAPAPQAAPEPAPAPQVAPAPVPSNPPEGDAASLAAFLNTQAKPE